MTSHPVPRKISFTGSVQTGKHVASSAAPDLKRVIARARGQRPRDRPPRRDPADVEEKIFAQAFANTGQICSAIKTCVRPGKRCRTKIVSVIASKAAARSSADGMEDGVEYGPITNKPQFERVKDSSPTRSNKGADGRTGWRAMDRPGYFFRRTVSVECDRRRPDRGRRQFGPALPILTYRSVDEAVDRANANDVRSVRFGVVRRPRARSRSRVEARVRHRRG